MGSRLDAYGPILPAHARFCSRISLPDNCLSVPRAIQLACELVPHAEETLAVGNPLGAKPVLIDMFEAEVPPNLRGADLFPITHRYVFPRSASGA